MHTLIRWMKVVWATLRANPKRSLLAGAVVIALVVVVVVKGGAPVDTSIAVTRGPIAQTVSVTGRLQAVQKVDLAFQNSGKVVSVPVAVGSSVVAGQLLASLDNADLNAQLRDAQASVLSQQAKLQELIAGSRPEDIAVAQSQLDKAQQDLDNAVASVYDVLLDAYTKTDSAVRIQTQYMFTSVGSEAAPQYTLTITCANCQVEQQNAVKLRVNAEIALNRWKQETSDLALNGSVDVLVKALQNSRGYIQTGRDLMASLGSLLDSQSLQLDATTVATYRSNISAGRASVVLALSAVSSQEQAIASQKLVVQQYANQLALKKAGSSSQAIASQRAQVQSAQAQADRMVAQIGRNSIRSPIRGIVTTQDAKLGQIATANTPLISVISDQQLEIEANVPEVDIGKVAVGNPVQVTVDALPGEHFSAKVTFIDPAETVIDGVVNFKVKILFDKLDERIKSGLTADVDIQVDYQADALILPQYALVENDTGVFVRKAGKDTPVTLGIRSAQGMVQILTGVSEGERVENIGIKKK